MPSAGLFSYSTSVNDNYSIYVNHGVGTGSTSSFSHSALYKIDYEPNPNYNVYDDSIKYFPVTFNDAEIIYRKNSGDAHGIVETSDKYLSVVDRDLNGITIVSFDDQTVNNNIVHYVEDRDIAMDLIDIGAENYDIENGVKYRNLYTSNRGSVPVSGNNSQINNAVGSQGGMSVIKSINNGKNVDLTYILNILKIVKLLLDILRKEIIAIVILIVPMLMLYCSLRIIILIISLIFIGKLL